MESTNVNTPSTATQPQTANAVGQSKPNDTNKYLCKIECSIRRKPDTVGLPGQDPAERIYRIGASIDSKTKGNLKGISGELETKFMPEIIGLSANDPLFRKGIEEYWSSISRVVPHDESYQREHEKGLLLKINFHLVGQARKDRFDKLDNVEERVAFLNEMLITPIKDVNTGQPTSRMLAEIVYDVIPDYLLLNYCLKYNKVANSINDIHKSAKIDFYIFERAIATKTQLNIIDLRQKAMTIYQNLEAEPSKIDAILLEFQDNPNKYDNVIDKLLRIDELYTTQPIDNMRKFVEVASDSNWEIKYIINNALRANLLRSPANTTAIYYNEVYLGLSINDAALTLTQDENGKIIKENLIKELSKK